MTEPIQLDLESPKQRHEQKLKGAKYTRNLHAWKFLDFFSPGDKVPDTYYEAEQVEGMLKNKQLRKRHEKID